MFDFDEKFIKELKKQDHNAFNTFYIKTVDVFFRYINSNYFFPKGDSEDIISNFYVKMWEAIKKYDNKISLNAYVWTILKNTIKDHLKKKKDVSFSVLDNDNSISFQDNLESEEDLTWLIENNFRFDQIEEAIKQLDDDSRDVIYFRFIEEKSNEEIEKILGISQENIRQKFSRAIKFLKSLLDSNNSDLQ
ncbi:sigma-70 family RNA polymerase sigma factor [Candidatus Gracilibacteria bacterium]|nr:sigma-70 family RNA polymerase sigma factor [Candidatus Gracilibacteria bacterium]